MSAEVDIAALDDGGENTVAEVRQALTSVLGRADRGHKPFSIVLIPDTQHLSDSSTRIAHFHAAAEWIAANRQEHNIQLVLHLGDVTHSANDTEYGRAVTPMETIWDTGVPFVACIGNHDYDGGSPASDHSDTTQWNTYFGVDRYEGRPWFDGAFETEGKSENFYLRSSLGGRPTLVLVLEFYPRASILEWAGEVIAAHPAHDVIIATHSYLNDDGTLTTDDAEHGPDAYSLADASSGVAMWNEFRKHPNVVAVFNGHHINAATVAELVSEGAEGNLVFQQFTNWQEHDEGGDGRIVILTVNPHTGWATRRVYNAADDAFEDDYELTFRLFQEAPSPAGDSPAGAIVVGTATIEHPDTTVSVPHGLPAAPDISQVQVTPINDLGEASKFWVAGVDETDITIAVDASPGDSNTAEFAWLLAVSTIPQVAGVEMVGAALTTRTDTGDTTISLNVPGGVQAGDLLVLWVQTRNSNIAGEPDGGGWDELHLVGVGREGFVDVGDTNEHAGIWTKVASGEESSISLLVDADGTDAVRAICMAFRNAAGVGDSSIAWGHTAESVDGKLGGILVTIFATSFEDASGNYTAPPAGMTELVAGLSGGNQSKVLAAWQQLAATGPAGTRTVLQSDLTQFLSSTAIAVDPAEDE